VIETKNVQRFDTNIYGAYLIRPKVFGDSRGYFFESWNKKTFKEIGLNVDFVQDNCSRSSKHVLRGLHYQIGDSVQGKLVGVTSGEVFDVFVDLRKDSPTFGKWDGYTLSTHQHDRLWIPPGCAHGFFTLTETADFTYKCTNYYDPTSDRSLIWNDPDIEIYWPLGKNIVPSLSKKDSEALSFKECEKYERID
jgi:dTDP-4-dehydrorhamnose 3,5-epimerase